MSDANRSEREAFEVWAVDFGMDTSTYFFKPGEPFERRDTQLAWTIWQAARQTAPPQTPALQGLQAFFDKYGFVPTRMPGETIGVDPAVSAPMPTAHVAAQADNTAERDMLNDARVELDMLREALSVTVEPHQTLFDRMMDAARAKADALAALAELVACKDLKDEVDARPLAQNREELARDTRSFRDYKRRMPLAWTEARRVIAATGEKE
jgi:hypothetical protein